MTIFFLMCDSLLANTEGRKEEKAMENVAEAGTVTITLRPV